MTERTKRTPLATDSAPGPIGRALLVDDLRLGRQLLHRMLERLGLELLEAVDGRHAMSVLASEPVDLVVSDIQMPRMGGLELVGTIRGSEHLCRLPVILVSADTSGGIQALADKAGANACFLKSDMASRAFSDTVRSLLDPT